MWGWTVDNFQLSETVLNGRTGRGGGRRLGQLRKLRVSRLQASLCAGACVCVRAHHIAGLACLHRAHPHLTGDPCAQAGPAAPPRWASRPGEPFADLPKCFEGAGELRGAACSGQGRASRARRGVHHKGLSRTPPCIGACAWQLTDDDVFYLFLQKQKIGAEVHIYLEEGTYHKRLFRGPNTNDMKK